MSPTLNQSKCLKATSQQNAIKGYRIVDLNIGRMRWSEKTTRLLSRFTCLRHISEIGDKNPQVDTESMLHHDGSPSSSSSETLLHPVMSCLRCCDSFKHD